MTASPPTVARLASSALALLLLTALAACRPTSDADAGWQGYLEAEYLHIATPLAGTLLECPVSRGSHLRRPPSMKPVAASPKLTPASTTFARAGAPPKSPPSNPSSLDGIPDPFDATVTHVATQPEFTPPVIYSRDVRARLVFRVEAQVPPSLAPRLHPGQPVDVRLRATPSPGPGPGPVP